MKIVPRFIDASDDFSNAKSKKLYNLINITLYILQTLGIPLNIPKFNTKRRLEKMALAFLAVGDVKTIKDLKKIKDANSERYLTTREIINYENKYLEEKISSGSYDDIRRKDLKLLVNAGIVLRSNPNSATNDSTRGYMINPFYADLIKKYDDANWETMVSKELQSIVTLEEKLQNKRDIVKIPVILPTGIKLEFTPGEHNILQKNIIEEFLPRYGYNSELLYVGDTTDKYLFLEKEKLAELNFFEISHEELPDIIAYSKDKNWLYLIEAVHSSGPISDLRLFELKKLVINCKSEIIYVTAFLDKETFRKYCYEIAWETEVWIAENPEHLIHFNGDKFLGPY